MHLPPSTILLTFTLAFLGQSIVIPNRPSSIQKTTKNDAHTQLCIINNHYTIPCDRLRITMVTTKNDQDAMPGVQREGTEVEVLNGEEWIEREREMKGREQELGGMIGVEVERGVGKKVEVEKRQDELGDCMAWSFGC
ncbi:hypothetical protein P154DRAFT_531823 [Amniculicola lignicola CBS 123094]|uniref:Uncharacterized protein n=1 Tax=Amniculicola lignicola CBS 123094 TaxID=1392246 RepID=A0A6A5WVG8_9PLEO|nr:hypothetical protein P154DRAFT_531823 [Amniculicola lignicola CBS 123094]